MRLDLENSPEVTEETLPGIDIARSSGVSEESLAAKVGRVGLLLIDIFWADETSVEEDTLLDKSLGGALSPSFGLASP